MTIKVSICFSGKDDLLTTGTLLEKLVVLNPNIKPIKAQLLYESYNGWIYSGRPHWRVDKVFLVNCIDI
jgi:hypothetical protein